VSLPSCATALKIFLRDCFFIDLVWTGLVVRVENPLDAPVGFGHIVSSIGLEIYRNTEFMIWSWGSAVCEALNVWDNKFVYTILPAMLVNSKPLFAALNDEITRLIGWDLSVCESGVGAEVIAGTVKVWLRGKLSGVPVPRRYRAEAEMHCTGPESPNKPSANGHAARAVRPFALTLALGPRCGTGAMHFSGAVPARYQSAFH